MSSEDEEYIEERSIVMVELQGVLEPEKNLFQNHSSFKLLGVDTDEPFLQLGNYVFCGEYEDTPGTVVFFEKPTEGSKNANYFCKTDKKLLMKRVFLEKKTAEPGNSSTEPDKTDEMETEPIPENLSEQTNNENNNSKNLVGASQSAQSVPVPEPDSDVPMPEQNGLLEQELPPSDEEQLPSNMNLSTGSTENDEGEETVEAIQRAVQALMSQDPTASQGETVTVSTSGTVGETPESAKQLCATLNGDILDTNDSEAVAEVSDSEVSGESDFIILSETDGSNDVSQDSSSNSHKPTAAADSSDCRPSTTGRISFHSPEVSNSESVARASCSNDQSISFKHKFVQKSVAEVQLVSSVDTGASTSDVVSEEESEDLADSASHLMKSPLARISDSSLPVICDSASNGKRGVISEGSYNNDAFVNSDENSVNDSAEIQSSSEAVGMGEEEDDDVEVEFVDVFDDDESIGQSDEHVSHSLEQGVCSSRIEPEADGLMLSSDHDGNVNESVETSQMQVSGSSESHMDFTDAQNVGESVNSTVGENSASESGTCDSANMTSAPAAVAGTSRDTTQQQRQASSSNKVKDSVDSTSNQVISCNQNDESLNLLTGIDSTSEHQNKPETYRESEESLEQNMNLVPNEAIDSTMNKFTTSDSILEEMDFEVREANDSGNEDLEIVEHETPENTQSIDSTSGRNATANNQPDPSCSSVDVAGPSVTSYDSYSNNSPSAEESVCQVSESCSEGSPSNITESSNTIDREISSPIRSAYSDDNGESSSSCRVTESHMDENRCSYSYHETPGSSRENNSASEVTESIPFSRSDESCAIDLDSKGTPEVTESLSVAYHENSLSSQEDSDSVETEARPSSSKQFLTYSNEESRPGSEDDVPSRVTESSSHAKPRNVSDVSHPEEYCTNAVTDSTNISNLADQDTEGASSLRSEDSSQCEVTESSSSCSRLHIVSEESSNSVSESSGAGASSRSSEVTHSFSAIGASTSTDISRSVAFYQAPSSDSSTSVITSGDQREPSSSETVTVTSASEMYPTATSSVASCPLPNSNLPTFSSVEFSANEANAEVRDGEVDEASPEEVVHDPSVLDSSESNAADSTEGNQSSTHQSQHSRSGSGDNSKLPSSTSN